MLNRLLKVDKSRLKSFFLFGPRGTGKTSWVKKHFPEALYIDLLKHQDFFSLQANPSRLENLVRAHSSPWVIIDEVQKIPALLDEVHRLIEQGNHYFILTGSSSRQLKRGGANLLAGRALTYHMHPLTAIEIGKSFNLDSAIKIGLLPLSYLAANREVEMDETVNTSKTTIPLSQLTYKGDFLADQGYHISSTAPIRQPVYYPVTSGAGLTLQAAQAAIKNQTYVAIPHADRDQDNAKHYLESYVATYLQEEVIQEGLVRQISAFSRFMEVASFSQGNQLNLANIAREVHVTRRIIEGYFDILEDLLMAVKIPCFTKRAQRELVQHPKFYYFDTGVYRQLRPKGPLDTPEEIGGAAFETLFLQNLRAIIDYERLDLSIYYWRTTTGVEVDFIVYGENKLFAFELKSKNYIERKDFSGLKKFQEDYPIALCFLIYTGNDCEKHGDMLTLPIQQALMELPKILSSETVNA